MEVKRLVSQNKEFLSEKNRIDSKIRELKHKSIRLQDQIVGNLVWINYFASKTIVHEDGSRTTTIPLVIE